MIETHEKALLSQKGIEKQTRMGKVRGLNPEWGHNLGGTIQTTI